MTPPRRTTATLALALTALAAAPGCQSTSGTTAATDPSAASAPPAAAAFDALAAPAGTLAVSEPGGPLRVQFRPADGSGRFIAALNGQDVTARFVRTGDGYVFAGHRFPADAAGTPQRIDFWTGRAEGPATQSATFTPSALAVRGNLGDDRQSRVSLPESGAIQLQVALPQRVDQPVTVTLTPAPQAGAGPIALAGAEAGRPVRVTFPAGTRVALVAARAAAPGQTTVEVSAPGYAAATLPVEVRESLPEFYGVGADLRKVEQNPSSNPTPADDAVAAVSAD